MEGIGTSGEYLDVKTFHIEIDHYGADRKPHSCPLYLLIMSTFKKEVGGLQTKLQ